MPLRILPDLPFFLKICEVYDRATRFVENVLEKTIQELGIDAPHKEQVEAAEDVPT